MLVEMREEIYDLVAPSEPEEETTLAKALCLNF